MNDAARRLLLSRERVRERESRRRSSYDERTDPIRDETLCGLLPVSRGLLLDLRLFRGREDDRPGFVVLPVVTDDDSLCLESEDERDEGAERLFLARSLFDRQPVPPRGVLEICRSVELDMVPVVRERSRDRPFELRAELLPRHARDVRVVDEVAEEPVGDANDRGRGLSRQEASGEIWRRFFVHGVSFPESRSVTFRFLPLSTFEGRPRPSPGARVHSRDVRASR